MKSPLPFAAALALALALALSLSLPAHAHNSAHVHGEGRLDVAIDGDTVELDLELPLDVAAGFERAPKNDKEKALLVSAGKTLNDAAALFSLSPAAKCSVQSVRVHMPFASAEGKSAGHAHEEDDHADIDAGYVFRCAAPGELRRIETTLFRHFRRLYRVEARRVGPAGQGAQRLTPKSPALAW